MPRSKDLFDQLESEVPLHESERHEEAEEIEVEEITYTPIEERKPTHVPMPRPKGRGGCWVKRNGIWARG